MVISKVVVHKLYTGFSTGKQGVRVVWVGLVGKPHLLCGTHVGGCVLRVDRGISDGSENSRCNFETPATRETHFRRR